MKILKKLLKFIAFIFIFSSCKKEASLIYKDQVVVTNKTIVDTLKDGLLIHFSFNGNLFDSSGNGNGIILNGANPTIDRFGNQNFANKFSINKNMYIQSPKSELNLMSNFSICAWILPDVLTNSVSMILSKHDGFTKSGWTFGLWNPLNLQLINFQANDQYSSATYPSKYPYLKGVIPISTWSYCIVVYDSSSKTLSYYLNGNLESTIPITFTTIANNNPITIGYQNSANWTDFFNGSIDEIRIYNRVLNRSEITYLSKH